jgi:hypothetical protein
MLARVILVAVVAIGLLAVPVAGGHLPRLFEVRFRAPWLLVLALSMQVVLATFGGPSTWWRLALHIASFPIGIAWVWLNRTVPGLTPGLWIVALGAVLNAAAIAANAGVMPASASALRTAGLPANTANLANSDVLEDPNLLFLGDVFAVPASWPYANVFSIGDVLVALGACVLIHGICGSRLVPQAWRAPHGRSEPAVTA